MAVERTSIKTIDDLKNFILSNEVSTEDLNTIISLSLGLYIYFEGKSKKQIADEVEAYYNAYKDIPITDRPLFSWGLGNFGG
ncbi:hypothetical protein EDL98_07770 [Ornithobacterium rhinotracheale]|uniref:hypothetical protein n=1 Tax=Ornithobacterium rhinotracheale TaxID=28251 RepID=UPI00129C6043|nr:hypothetical protein [Ornithobacterium rhinotracheale]MRJ10981.1 hypothetical protein [Ornithobacterium rhinotracheale]